MYNFHEIQQIICSGQDISILPVNPLMTKTRKREIVLARQLVMYFLRLIHGSKLSWAKIGGFYHKDHATAMHAVSAINNLIDTDRHFLIQATVYEVKIRTLIDFEKNLMVDNFESIRTRIMQMANDNSPIPYEIITLYNSLLEKTNNPAK